MDGLGKVNSSDCGMFIVKSREKWYYALIFIICMDGFGKVNSIMQCGCNDEQEANGEIAQNEFLGSDDEQIEHSNNVMHSCFRDVGEIERTAHWLSKRVRDYYILVPADAKAEKAIRTKMRLACVRHRPDLSMKRELLSLYTVPFIWHGVPTIRVTDSQEKPMPYYDVMSEI
ncbi:hypothetical protein C5167_040216 [Papaver somniferum]|uniref:Uncharacterized protein n=1 Tax=Papaver somniferum TaxID=3469 RepID=A0A4Y7IEH3_PAPSO|nr:hypothetical protein C5167_040216 [Papaver somniferum]